MQFLLVEYVMTPNDIMQIVLGVLGSVAIVLLVIFLIYLIKTMRRISKVVDEVSEPVVEVVEALPGLIEPSQTLIDGLSKSVPAILDDVSSMSGEMTGAIDSVKSFFQSRSRRQPDSMVTQFARVVGFLAGIMAAFRQDKSKKKKKKK